LRGIVDDGMSVKADERVVVWIRTHSVDFAVKGKARTDSDANKLRAQVLLRSYQGVVSDFVLDAQGQKLTASVEYEADDAPPPNVGDTVDVEIPIAAVHVLATNG
jgi:hypothetical protein